jgi:hypothetical protein
MRLANRQSDFWELRSAEEAHAANPSRFWIPDSDKRRSLERGHAAKLIFDIEAYEEDGAVGVQGERMWVIVAERVGDRYIGILDNQPACLEPSDKVYLIMGAEIPFGPEHVIDIADPPAEHVEWQLGQEPERRWPRG